MATINATYKRRNNSNEWDDIYFKTSAGQVGVSSSRKFVTTSTKVNNVAFALDSSGDGASVTLYAGDIKMSLNDSTTLAAKIADLQNLDDDLTKIAALTGSGMLKRTVGSNNTVTWSLDNSSFLTTTNYSTTLGSVYQAKHANLTSISGLSTSSTGLIKMTNGVASIDTTSYATTSAIANMVTASSTLTSNKLVYGNGSKGLTASSISYSDVVTASSNFTTDKIIVANGNNKTLKASTYSVTDLVDLANGASEAWATDLYDNGTKLLFGKSASSASESVANLSNTTTVTITGSTEEVIVPSGYTYLYCLQADGEALRAEDGKFSIKIDDLQIGDVLYITNTDVPDFWWDGGSFKKLETTKVDLDDYALASSLSNYVLKTVGVTGVSYNTSNHKIQKTINGSTTDVVDLDDFASLNDSTGAISIGGVSKTPLYDHQTMKYRAIKVAGTQQIADTSNTALNFLNGGNVTFTWDSTNTGVKASVDLSSYLTSIPSDYHKIYYSAASSAPSSPSTGDFWIATS